MRLRLLGAQWLAVALVGAVSFFISTLVARRFGPDLFGLYATTLSAAALATIVIDAGFSRLLQRERAAGTAALAALAPHLPGWAYGHALLAMPALVLLAWCVYPSYRLTVLAAVGWFGAAVLNQFGLALLRGEGRLVRDAGWQVGNRLLTALCVVLALWLGAGQPWQVLAAQCAGAALFGALALRALRVRPCWRPPLAVYRAVLPFIWVDLATVVYFRSDLLMFSWLGVARAQAGLYGVAYRVLEALLLLAAPVGLFLFRRFRQHSAAPAQLARALWPALAIGALAGAGLAWCLSWGAAPLLAVAYGAAYRGAAPLLVVLGYALVFILPNGILMQAALALGMGRGIALAATLAALVNVLGNLYGMPRYGGVAAAWMTVLTEAVLGAALVLAVLARCRRIDRENKEWLL